METIWDFRKMQSDVLLSVPDRTMDGLETKAVVRTHRVRTGTARESKMRV